MRNKNDNSNKWLVRSIAFLILVILGIFGYAMSKEINKKKQINQEIQSLKQEAESIKKENMQLDERISYLGSKDYQEIEAKDKLNLQSPDEKLVVIKPGVAPKDIASAPAENIPAPVQSPEVPNYQKWWNYFFK